MQFLCGVVACVSTNCNATLSPVITSKTTFKLEIAVSHNKSQKYIFYITDIPLLELVCYNCMHSDLANRRRFVVLQFIFPYYSLYFF